MFLCFKLCFPLLSFYVIWFLFDTFLLPIITLIQFVFIQSNISTCSTKSANNAEKKRGERGGGTSGVFDLFEIVRTIFGMYEIKSVSFLLLMAKKMINCSSFFFFNLVVCES